MKRSRTYIATPPGLTIREQIKERNLSQKEFSSRMDLSEKHVSRLINGEVQLTPDVAMRLEMVLGIPARFWNNLESIYREKLVLIEEENRLDNDIEIARKFPYEEMAKQGWVPEAKTVKERVIPLRKFFEIARLDLLENPKIPSFVCNKLKTDYAMLAFAQKAKTEARNIDVKEFNCRKLESIIPEIESITCRDHSIFLPSSASLLSGCGVVLIPLSPLGDFSNDGIVFSDKDRIIIALNKEESTDRIQSSLLQKLDLILKTDHIK